MNENIIKNILILSTRVRVLKAILLRIRAVLAYESYYSVALDYKKIHEEEQVLVFKIARNKEKILSLYLSLEGYKKEYTQLDYIPQNDIEQGYVEVMSMKDQYAFLRLSDGKFIGIEEVPSSILEY